MHSSHYIEQPPPPTHARTQGDNDAAVSDKFPFGDWTSVPSLVPPQQMSNHPNITAGTEQHSG